MTSFPFLMTVLCSSVNQSGDGETEYGKQQKKVSQLRDQLVALEKTDRKSVV